LSFLLHLLLIMWLLNELTRYCILHWTWFWWRPAIDYYPQKYLIIMNSDLIFHHQCQPLRLASVVSGSVAETGDGLPPVFSRPSISWRHMNCSFIPKSKTLCHHLRWNLYSNSTFFFSFRGSWSARYPIGALTRLGDHFFRPSDSASFERFLYLSIYGLYCRVGHRSDPSMNWIGLGRITVTPIINW